MTKRLVCWTGEGLEFWECRGRKRGHCVAKLPFEKGSLGAYALLVGTWHWLQAHNASEHWVRRAKLPAGIQVVGISA